MLRVLVVDDEDPMRQVIRRVLEGAGYSVLEAADGVEAVSLTANCSVDLVLTDIIMPNREGIETILRLRQSHPSAKFIAMSGGGRARNLEFLEVARKIGVAGTLAKPFRKSELLEAVRAAMEDAF